MQWPPPRSSPPPPPPSASSSSTSSAAAVASWWRDSMHPAAYGAWTPPPPAATMAPHQQHGGRTTTSSGGGADDDLSAPNATMTSFTNTSTTNHSGLSMDSGGAEVAAAVAAESHLWNQVLMGAGGEVGRSMQAVHDAHDDSENFLELLNSRTLAPELFAEPPACDYLKKMEYGSSHGGSGGGGGGGWPDHHQFTTAALEKHVSSGYGAGALAHQHQSERLTANLSDLVSNWSIAPPSPCLGDAHHRAGVAAACDNNAAAVAALGHGAKAGLFLDSGGGVCKHEIGGHGHGHGAMLEEAASGGSGAGGGGQEFLRPVGYSSMLGLSSNRMYMDVPWSNNAGTASLSDLISFGGAPLGKPEQPAPATSTKAQAEYKKQGHEISSPAKTSSGGGSKGSSEGKKKRSEEQQGSEGNAKKSKNEASSPTSSLKASQVPKVKLGDKITALQQIVSPFGKTDTASVLYEAINYIKWLHEQVQLLNDPYMKTSSSKDYNASGGLDRKEKSETEIDLRSRGLCLVPVSCTPQVYRDNNGPDYWTPPYRSCLYR
ncbi:transcription factor bHLH111-like [Miscanthus floridulus]|uniref:transcription factor bHLH111-like n=1 Tax=Miscanthus floridulus TaxID=154761 RepID=UPI003458705C